MQQHLQPHLRTGELSTRELANRCLEETRKFLRGHPSDERYSLALFRRAIVERDEHAWASLYQQYAPLVLTWIARHPVAAEALEQDGGDALVNAAFAKFS